VVLTQRDVIAFGVLFSLDGELTTVGDSDRFERPYKADSRAA
jgi:hypothetical protein